MKLPAFLSNLTRKQIIIAASILVVLLWVLVYCAKSTV
jgi:hypothetical protein